MAKKLTQIAPKDANQIAKSIVDFSTRERDTAGGKVIGVLQPKKAGKKR